MTKHGSIQLYVHGNQKVRQDGQPRTATSTLTQLLNYEAMYLALSTGHAMYSALSTGHAMYSALSTGHALSDGKATDVNGHH